MTALRTRRLAVNEPAALGAVEAGLPVLAGDKRFDAWFGGSGATSGTDGAAVWRGDGSYTFGRVDLLEDDDDGRAETARRAYGDIFAALDAAATPHLLRLWNVVPRINDDDGDGLERYRRFNAGRQQAFIDAGRSAVDGAPAASAVGRRDGPLSVCFLASQQTPLALENPRQVPAWRYSQRWGPRSPTFSRAVLADAGDGQVALFVSGTASIAGEESLHPGDVRAQLAETVVNLQAVLAAARARCSAAFEFGDLACTVFLRHAADLDAVRGVFDGAIVLQADICRAELLVEVEGHAMLPGMLER